MIKAIIFDFDGVIVESTDIKTGAFARLFEAYGKKIVHKVVVYHLKNAGVSRYEKFKYIYKEILKQKLCRGDFDVLCRRFASLVLDSVVNASYVKGARSFLERYSKTYKCFVVSATPHREINEIIRRRKMQAFFRGIYGAPLKKREAVRRILIRQHIGPREAIYLGDALSDYNAARDNSVDFIARIHNNKSLFSGIDCPKVRDLTRLGPILKNYARRGKNARE